MQAEEPGATDPSKASDGAHRVQVRDETYAISDDRWTRIFPDAAAKEKAAGAAASAEPPATAARAGTPWALIAAGCAIVAVGAGAVGAWVLWGQGPHHVANAPAQVVSAPPSPPPPVAPVPTPAPPPPLQTAGPIMPATAAPPSPTAPVERPHHRLRDDGTRDDGDDRDRTERHEAEDTRPAEAPPPPPPAAKKGNAVSRFFGHLFGGHHAPADQGSSSGGEKPAPNQ